MVVHAALSVLLARLSGTSDIAIGTPVAGRGEAVLDDVIGMFVNTLVLRADVQPGASFEELLGQVRSSDLAAFGHADVPFERLVEILDPARSQARHPLFQVMLTFQNLGNAEFTLGDLAVSEVEFDSAAAKFDLQVTVLESGAESGYAVALTYATDLFDASTCASSVTGSRESSTRWSLVRRGRRRHRPAGRGRAVVGGGGVERDVAAGAGRNVGGSVRGAGGADAGCGCGGVRG